MKPRTIAGLVMTLAAVPCIAASVLILTSAIDMDERAERQIASTERQCKERLATLGELTTDRSGGLKVVVAGVTDPRAALSQATAAQVLCQRHTLADFCLGEACGGLDSDVTLVFTMRRSER